MGLRKSAQLLEVSAIIVAAFTSLWICVPIVVPSTSAAKITSSVYPLRFHRPLPHSLASLLQCVPVCFYGYVAVRGARGLAGRERHDGKKRISAPCSGRISRETLAFLFPNPRTSLWASAARTPMRRGEERGAARKGCSSWLLFTSTRNILQLPLFGVV